MPIAVSGSNIVFADGSSIASGFTGFKNRIINGAMVIDQRNAGVSVSAVNDIFTLDRWATVSYDGGNVTGKFTVQQNAGSVTPPAGFTNYLGVTSSAATSYSVNGIFSVEQRVEGYNISDLAWGTANAKTVTLSFWVRSSLTGTFGGSLMNGGYSRSYPFSYTISSANTWEQKSVTIPGDTTGTWATNNTLGIRVYFGLGVGSTYSGTVNTWASAQIHAPTGATSVVGTNGATWYVTGVQLEAGSSATSFEYRDYGNELRMCQRYYWKQSYTVTYNRYGTGIGLGDSTIDGILINLPVPMRTSPTNSVNALGAWDGTNTRNVTALNSNYSTNVMFAQQATADGVFTAGKVIQLYATGSTSFVSSSAEL